MRLRLRKVWAILAVLLCVGGAFCLRGVGQKDINATDVTSDSSNPPTESQTETTTPPDASSGQYKMWFLTEQAGDNQNGDLDFKDPDGLSQVQWNMKIPEGSEFKRPNTGKVTAMISIAGDTPADLSNEVDYVEWSYDVSGGGQGNIDVASIVDIQPAIKPPYEDPWESFNETTRTFRGTGKATTLELLFNTKTAGLVEVTFHIKGYRGDNLSSPVIMIDRKIIVGSPLQIYSFPVAPARDYTDFGGEIKDNNVIIYTNNKEDLAPCHIYWFFVDAKGNYSSVSPRQVLLDNLGDIPEFKPTSEMLQPESEVVSVPKALGSVIDTWPAPKDIPLWSYNLEAKKTGGFTRLVGRIYFGGDSKSDAYIECFYDVINAAEFKVSDNPLKLRYGEKRAFNVLANDKNKSLGWASYSNYTTPLKGTKEDSVLVIEEDGVTAQNYGNVILEAAPLYNDWEKFDKVSKDVVKTLNVYVAPDVLKGSNSKEIIDYASEVITVGGTIQLSTNIDGNGYSYEWYYKDGAGNWVLLTTGSGSTQAPQPKYFSVSGTASEDGYSAIVLTGRESGRVEMKCDVKRAGKSIMEDEDGNVGGREFVIKVVDTMTLSETRKTIAVGNSFEIQAFISAADSANSVSWKVAEEWEEYISIESTGRTTALVTGLASTNNVPVLCTATYELNGTTVSANFYVTVIPAIYGARIEATPSSVISVGGSTTLDLILDTEGTSFTEDQIKWVLKDKEGQELAEVILEKTDDPGDILKTKVKGLQVGEAYVAAVTNDEAQTEIAVITIKVVSEVTGLKLNANEVKGYLPSGEPDDPNTGTFVLVATPLPEGYTDAENLGIKWSAAPDNGTVTITPDPEDSLKATVTYNEIGTVRVTAEVSGLPAAADFCMFTIENSPTGIRLEPPGPYELRVGETQIVTPILTPENVTDPNVTWTMANPEIATVSAAGVITGVAPGTTFVTCTTSNKNVSIQYPVTVLNPVEGIELNYTELVVKKGTVFFLSANVLPEDAADRTVTWSTSDEGICTVDDLGMVTANSTGVCVIRATSNDNPEIWAECRVTVTESVAGITLNYREKTIDIGETFVLKATVLPSDANDRGVTFTSSNPAIATVNEDGLVTGVSGGTTIIVVRTNDRGLIATCTVTVQQDITGITFDVTDMYLPKGETRKISYTITPANATIQDLEWSSSDPSIAFVDSEGYVHGVALGEVTITATAKDGTKISATCKVTVINPITEIRLSETSLIMMEGDEHTLTYIISPQNATITDVKWTSSDVSVATVNSLGIVKALREGETRIRVEATDNSGVYAECIVIVKPYIPITSINLNSTETTMILGDTRRLTDRTYPNNTTERSEWRSSDTGIVTVDGDGNVVAVGPGTCTVSKIGVTSGIEGTCIIHVIGLTATDITLEKYDTFDLYLDDPDEDIRWFSRDKRTATVSRDGVVTGRRPGTTYIVADLNGKLVSCRVTVLDMNRSQQDTVNAASNIATNSQ